MSDRNQGQGQDQGSSSSVSAIRDTVVEGARRHADTLKSAANAATEQFSEVMDHAGEYASEAAAGMRRQMTQPSTATTLICVGAGLIVGGVALHFLNSRQPEPQPQTQQKNRGGRSHRGGRRTKGG